MSGRLIDVGLGKVVFALVLLGFNLRFFPMPFIGACGMPRRIYTYDEGMGWEKITLLETVGAFILATGILLFIISLVRSARNGAKAGPNPWDAATLEWLTESPPAVHNFDVTPMVY